MLKPLTLSLSFALALGASSVSMAGLFDHGGGGGCSPWAMARARMYPGAGGGLSLLPSFPST